MCAVCLFLASIGGVTRAEDPATPSENRAPEAAFTRIVLSDSGGFTGHGTGKRLAIDGSGKLQLNDRKGNVVDGQLTKQQLADLAGDVAAVDWSAVEKLYPSRGADMIQNDLTVTIGGKTHMTHAVPGEPKVPAALKSLFSRLAGIHRQFAPAKN